MTRLSLGSARGALLECSLSQSSLVTNEREGKLARLYNTRPNPLEQEESCFARISAAPLRHQGHRALSKSYQGIQGPPSFGAKVANRDGGFQALYSHVCILRVHGSHVFVILHDWCTG